MKCPNCGAETQSKFCEYCGSEIVQDKANVNITNNYYINENPANNNQNISNTNNNNLPPKKKRKIWLWVLGWICIFPVPLTILLVRNKNLNTKIKIGIIAFAWIIYLIIGLTGGSSNDSDTKETPTTEAITTEAIKEDTKTETPTEDISTEENSVIYEDDEKINLFLNRYNEANETPITKDDFSVYHHHGSDHKDQIIMYDEDFEVVISSGYPDIKIVITSTGTKTEQDFYQEFAKFSKAYNNSFDEAKINDYWQQVLDDITNSVRFDDLEVDLTVYNEKAEMLVINGDIQ